METKNKKNRRRLLIVLLFLLVIGCGTGSWLLWGHEPAQPGAVGPVEPEPVAEQTADEPATPEAADPGSGEQVVNETEPETSAPTPPTEPSQEQENGGGSAASGNTSSGSGNGSSGSSGSKGGASTPAPVPTPTPTPTPAPRPTPAPTPAPAPHTHKYADTRTEPTCTQPGQIMYTCSCGDVQTEILAALGHDHSEAVYETRTYEVVVGYEQHVFCRACGADLTDLSLDEKTSHSRAHALNGESSSRYEDWIEITETVTEEVIVGHKCSRCGDIKPMPQ